MAYPATADSFTNPAGTTLFTGLDHAGQHGNANDAIENIETVLGTTAGTSVLKGFAAGNFPLRINTSNVIQQTVTGGTINNTVVGTSKWVGGTINSVVMGTPTITGGVYNNQTLGTPAITGGTINSVVMGTPNITGGTHSAAMIGTSTIRGGTVTSAIPAPQGFLINGKIVPSVASNNLTVAIKGMDGNDPSATNPVYVRIDNAVRSITSALSITANAGVNWMNSGGAELATKEVDYFVYAIWGNNTAVKLGFGRRPHWLLISDSNTAANDSDNTMIGNGQAGVVSTDPCEVIGRFAATLSAGAGYTWTVPTFTNINLIQRPIYETRELSWLPTYTCSGSLTWTSTSTGTYKISGGLLNAVLCSTGTTGGTASTDIITSLPLSISANDVNMAIASYLYDSSWTVPAIAMVSAASTVTVAKSSNWALAVGKAIRYSFTAKLI